MKTALRGRRGARVLPFRGLRCLSTLAVALAMLPFGAFAAAHATTNLVSNPSFETSTTGWVVTGGSMIARVAGGADGDWALEVRGPAAPGTFGINDSPNWVKLVAGAGTRYRFSAKVRSDSARGAARLQIREYKNGVQQGATYKSASVTLSPEWRTLTGEFVATVDSATLDFHILDAATAASEVFLIDDVSIVADVAPVVTVNATAAAAEGAAFELHVTASDANGDAITSLTADLAGLPAGSNATFTADSGNASGVLAWTPGFDHAGGPYVVRFVASNALADTAATGITVTETDRAPAVAAEASVAAQENAPVTVHVTASDPDGHAITTLTADLSALPAGHDAAFTVDSTGATGTLAWTPTHDDAGTYTVRFVAANALADTAVTDLVVGNTDRPPVVTAPENAAATEAGALTIEISVADPDGDPITTLTADLAGLPAGSGAVFTPGPDGETGTLEWTPDHESAPGPWTVTFVAANVLADSAVTTIAVADVDRAPEVDVEPAVAADEGAEVMIEVIASDPDGQPIDSLVADFSGLPAGHAAAFFVDEANGSGMFVWTPDFDDAGGPYTVTFTAANAMAGGTSTAITVNAVDRRPLVTAPATATVQDSAAIQIEVTVADPDGDAITGLMADLGALPAGHDAVFVPSADHASGTLTWTPRLGGSGTFPITFVAANAVSDTAATVVTVNRIEHPPVIEAPPLVAMSEGESLLVTVTVSDPDGDPIDVLEADLSGLPAGANATFTPAADRLSGMLAWMADHDDAGGPYAVTFLAAAHGDTAAAAVAISVDNVDRAPVVTAPATAALRVGGTLTVTVQAADPDGEAIASLFADLSALPAGHGARFTPNANATEATLSWAPGVADTGGFVVSFTAENGLSGSATTSITVRPPNRAPVATLSVSPAITSAPMLVTASAAGSSDPDDVIASYRFDFGNGVVVGPQSSPIASATYALAGVYDVTVIVTDGFGASDTATVRVQAHLGNLCTNPGLENSTTGWTAYGAGAAIVRVNGAGRSGSYAFQASKAAAGGGWGFNDSPDWVPATAGVGRKYRYLAWVRSPSSTGSVFLRVQEFLGSTLKGTTKVSPLVALSDAWQLVSVDYTVTTPGTRLDMKIVYDGAGANEKFLIDDVQVLLLPPGDQPPVVMAPAAVVAIAGQPLTVPVRVADPDGQAIASLGASRALLPPGHDASFTADPDLRGGTLSWTPQAADVGPVPYTVTITAANGLSTSVPVEIVVAPAALANLCANPGFEASASGWSPYVSGTALTRVNAGRSGRFGILLAHATATGWGVNDQLDIVNNTAVAGRTYRYAAWVRSVTTGSKVRMRIQEFLGATQKGATVESPELTLTSQWQRIAASYTATLSGSRLDMKLVNAPVGANQSFLVDDVEVLLLPAGDRPPVASAPATITAPERRPMTVSVVVSDPDGDPITNLVADLSALPAGHGATFTAGAGNGTGILSWTPGAADARATPYVVTFTATNARTAIASTAITVTDTAHANLVANPGFETNLSGWGTYGAATIARVAGGHSGGWAMRMATAGASSFGADDVPNAVASVAAAGERFRFSAWVRSDSSTSPVKLRVYEFLGGVQQGPVIHSYEMPVSSTWQLLTVDHTALTAGATISLRVTMQPASAGQSFLVDDVAVARLPAGAALVVNTDDAVATPAAAEGPRAVAAEPRVASAGEGHVDVRIEGMEALLEGGMPEVSAGREGRRAVAEIVALGDDADANGREELCVRFAVRDLRGLLAGQDAGAVMVTVSVRRGDESTLGVPLALEWSGEELAFTASFAPNPMRGEGTLAFALPRTGPVRVDLFDPAGRRVRTLMNETQARAGRYALSLGSRGARLAAGVYFFRVDAAEAGARAGRVVVLE